MIKRFNNFTNNETSITLEYPQIRHLSSYESAISILESGFLLSRNELKKNIEKLNPVIVETKNFNSKDKWWTERKDIENKRFESEDIIYCTPDWFNDSGYETGHGPVMFYFKPSIFEDFNVTLTIEDSLTENRNRIYTNKEIQKIYDNILNKNSNSEYQLEANKILENLNHKNKESIFTTSRGRIFIEGDKFYNKYSELQIHAKKIPVSYIQDIRLTDNYFCAKDSDKELKEKFLLMYKQLKS